MTLTQQRIVHRSALAAAIALALGSSGSALASGFSVPEVSTAGLSTANAMVANPEERGAFAYNPSAMAFHEHSSIAVGALLLSPSFSVRNDTGKHDSNNADWLGAPMIQAAIRINDKFSAGLGLNAPFGLETRWQRGTFPMLTGTATIPTQTGSVTVPLSPQPTQSKLEILDVVPTVAYRVNDDLALSAGADIYYAKSGILNSTLTKMDGEGYGYGFNVSALYTKGPFSAGLAFRSAATVNLSGNYEALDPTLVAFYRATGGATGTPPNQHAELDLDLPWRLQLGVRYEITPQLAVEADWTRTGWSQFEKIKVKGIGSTIIAEDILDFEDTNAYRFGLTYQLMDTTQLRFGYSYDESAQPNEYFSPRVPDNDRQLFSIGIAHQFSGGVQIEAGYMYATTGERKVYGSRPYDLNHPADINGTTAVAGKYESDVHLIALELSAAFDVF